MRGRIKGTVVHVRKPVNSDEVDELGNPVTTWSEPETVSGVTVARDNPVEALEANRPYGVTSSCTLTFPKSYTESLRGCEIQLPGDETWWRVLGNPLPQIDGQTLMPYNGRNRVVRIGVDDG